MVPALRYGYLEKGTKGKTTESQASLCTHFDIIRQTLERGRSATKLGWPFGIVVPPWGGMHRRGNQTTLLASEGAAYRKPRKGQGSGRSPENQIEPTWASTGHLTFVKPHSSPSLYEQRPIAIAGRM